MVRGVFPPPGVPRLESQNGASALHYSRVSAQQISLGDGTALFVPSPCCGVARCCGQEVGRSQLRDMPEFIDDSSEDRDLKLRHIATLVLPRIGALEPN
jgi:hypothetical protein